MSPVPVYALVFERDMRRPQHLACNDVVEFLKMVEALIRQRGPIEIMYRVY